MDEPIDSALLAELERLMTVERLYRYEGLTIGALAAKLGLPERRLRRTINRGLGFRNFSEYLNRHRLADAKQALADPAQAEVPILTIALDSGFQSLGPFNRAFKTDTGMTPTEFRRSMGRDRG
jgi:AraC-like DNA-binding protein